MKMQDQYVGDIGDYAKYALLRALSEGRQLGVAWYLYRGGDGRFTQYLDNDAWNAVDPGLFDSLHGIMNDWRIAPGPRSVWAVQQRELLPEGTVFANVPPLDTTSAPRAEPEQWRRDWSKDVMDQLQNCDIVFADPDKGLVLDDDFRWNGTKDGWQHIPLSEARALSKQGNRPTVIYHHHNHSKRDDTAETQAKYWMGKLPGPTYTFLMRRYNVRMLFVVNPDEQTVGRLKEFEIAWQNAEKKSGLGSNLSTLICP